MKSFAAHFNLARRWLLRLMVAIVLAGLTARVFGQATLTTLFTNGPASNRVNIVLFSEGYKTNQLAQFLVDAASTVSNMLSQAPYKEYSNYFNAYAVSVASTNSGSNHTTSGNTNNSYFNSTYWSSGISQLVTIPPNDRDANYADGTGKVLALLTNQNLYASTNLSLVTNVLPQLGNSTNRFVVLVVNDTTYGGSGQPPNPTNALLIAVTSLGSTNGVPAFDIIAHESGHVLAGLADEYTNAYAGFTPVERPNATTNTDTNYVVWKSWIPNNVPTPTEDNDTTYASFVGLFPGAQYNSTGWYRPHYDCKMNHLGVPFCPVCSEAIVKALYQKVRAVDAITPASISPIITSTQSVNFSITPLLPRTHGLSIQWFTNNVAVTNATNSTFAFNTASMTNGNYSVLASVRDITPLVINDPSNYLSNAVIWNVTVGVASLRMISPKWATNGFFSCTVTGVAPFGFTMLASTNLSTWTPLSTNALTNGVFNFTNNPALPRRFYRTSAN